MKNKIIIIIFLIIFFIFSFIALNKYKLNVELNESRYLIPLGNVVGIRANTDGILVLGNEEEDKEYIGGVKAGDNIVSIDGVKVNNSKVVQILNDKKPDTVEAMIDRNGEYIKKEIQVKEENGIYKLGIWGRDKISGIGTMTFYDPQNKEFSALGHAITDMDTNKLIKVKEGNIYEAKNIEIIKATEKDIGQIKGEFDTDNSIGKFSSNNKFGINGNLVTYDNEKSYKILEVGSEKNIELGPAIILFENKNGIVEEYSIEIKKINRNSKKSGKDMVVEVVDDRLLDYTGGIVQGMSGSPIIQNNKLIGAITHVFIDNSKIGYGVFIDKMIK